MEELKFFTSLMDRGIWKAEGNLSWMNTQVWDTGNYMIGAWDVSLYMGYKPEWEHFE